MQTAAMPTGKPLRLFIALWPDEPLRDALASWQQSWAWPARAARVPRERLHLTLHFLGDVPAEHLPRLVDGLTARFAPFELTLGHGEVWPNGVAVLRPENAPGPLLVLQAALRRELVALGVPVEARAYRPHVTLARRAQGAEPPACAPAVEWLADSGYVLARSLPGGAGYEVLHRFA
jgi:RNA 2',3'-cyclic 3'-phosphodiesterase